MAEIELDRREAADGDLPPVCVYCGAPAGGYRTKVFRGTTPFTRFSRFWYRCPRVALPVCGRHRPFTLRRNLLLFPALAAFLAGLALLAAVSRGGPLPGPLASLQSYTGVLTGLVIALFLALVGLRIILFYTDIRCTDLSTVTITLANVSDRFVAACHGGEEPLIAEALPAYGPAPGRRRARRGADPPRRRGSGWLWVVLGAGTVFAGLGCLVCSGGLVLVYGLPDGLPVGAPIVLSSPRQTHDFGLVRSLQVQYRFRRGGPIVDASYVLVVSPVRGQAQRRSYSGRELRSSGTLQIDMAAPPFGGAGFIEGVQGPYEVFVEVEPAQPGAPRERASNVVTVREPGWDHRAVFLQTPRAARPPGPTMVMTARRTRQRARAWLHSRRTIP